MFCTDMELDRYRTYSTISSGVSQVIEKGSEDEWLIYGYEPVRWKIFVSKAVSVLTLGFWALVLHWRPSWKVSATCRPCHLQKASQILLINGHGQKHVVSVAESARLLEMSSEFNVQDEEIDTDDSAHLTSSPESQRRYFEHQLLKCVWDNQNTAFRRLRGYEDGTMCSDFYTRLKGLDEIQQQEKLNYFGKNIMDIRVKSYASLFIDEMLNPFYFFQIASITLWCLDDYYYYASCIFIITLISISVSLYETKKQMKTLKAMIVEASPRTVTIRRLGGEIEEVPAAEVAPGDVLVIPPTGCVMACDAVLTAGNCIVNESMLTGESVPETKTPVTKCTDFFDIQKHKRHILFAGTQVIQTRYYGSSSVTATVIRTGFLTAKGELVRSILFPKPMGFQFYRDSMRFVLILLCLAACGTAYSLYLYISRHASVSQTVKKALDVITIVVPPALPAALTVGTVYAQSRLKKRGIFCISPPRINLAGKIKLMCFDKTGTLTEGGLDYWGVIPVQDTRFQSVVREGPQALGERHPILLAMATCHSLTSIDGQLAGDPLDLKMFEATEWVLEEFGKDTNRFDQLVPSVVRPPRLHDYWARSNEELTFVDGNIGSAPKKVTHGEENEMSTTEPLPLEVGLVRQFPFSSSLQCMSVICRVLGSSHMDLFCKGAPEKMASLCLPDTVPRDFSRQLERYTQQGLRVLALAHKKLDSKLSWHQVQRIKREKLECDLTMVGLIIMQNALKPETSAVISVIRYAAIRMVMITGDNILTATSVGRDCGLIPPHHQVIMVNAEWDKVTFQLANKPELDNTESSRSTVLQVEPAMCEDSLQSTKGRYCVAMEGKSFSFLRIRFPGIFKRMLLKGTIFARMSPDEKTQLVESFQELGYVTGMCGDGANDCGALKTADVGISLSEAEASVAAPFTSHIPNIECVPIVVREGRCALVTSFALFKFIALYSIIQFVSVLILYSKGSNLSDAMFLYIDLAVITTLAIVMGNTHAYPELVKERPLSSLVNASNVVSILLQVILVTGFQATTLLYLTSQRWYHPLLIDPDNITFVCWESTSIFLVSCFQYLIVAVVFSHGPPFRKSIYTNAWFVVALIVLVGFTCLLLFNPWSFLRKAFQLVDIGMEPKRYLHFRLILLFISCGNLLCSFGLEVYVAQTNWLKRLCRWIRRKREPKNEYKRVDAEMQNDPNWPPLHATLTADLPFHGS